MIDEEYSAWWPDSFEVNPKVTLSRHTYALFIEACFHGDPYAIVKHLYNAGFRGPRLQGRRR